MTWLANVGLVAFVLVVLLNAAGLLLDLFFVLTGHPTITSNVMANPANGIPILALQVVGLVGLACHFYCRS